MRKELLHWTFLVLLACFCLFYPFALIGLALNILPPFSQQWPGSLMLFIEGCTLIVAAIYVHGPARTLVAALCVIVLSYLVEALGVNTGFPFGTYHYTDKLAPVLPGGVPLPVMFAWVLIVFGVYGLVKRCYLAERGIGVGTALLSALLAVLHDLAIEPVAARVVFYWQWLAPGWLSYYGIPLANFVAWFVVTFMLLFLVDRVFRRGHEKTPHEWMVWTHAQKMGREEKSRWIAWVARLATPVPIVLFLCSILMFGLVDLTHGYYWSALLVCCACVIIYVLWRPYVFKRHN